VSGTPRSQPEAPIRTHRSMGNAWVVLHIEPDPLVGRSIATMLELACPELVVAQAQSIGDADKIMGTLVPDVVLTADVGLMPARASDVVSVSRGVGLPVVILTGGACAPVSGPYNVHHITGAMMRHLSGVPVVIKPADPDELLRVLQQARLSPSEGSAHAAR
jgi:hypothetical protein